MEHIVKNVLENSIAEELEIEPGDNILAVNDHPIEDIFDYQYLINDEYIELLVKKSDGEEWLLEIEKDYDEDLGIVFALVSSFKNRAIPSDMVMFGEMGLSGEVRGVSGAEQRVREAAKMGFKTCIIPKSNMDNVKKMKDLGDMKVVGVANIQQALEYI